MHTFLLSLLAFFARILIIRHRPYVIGVTGTVGKTTLSRHIAGFLIQEFGAKQIRYSSHHYNGEYGLPLTIIGVKTPGRNPFLWIYTFLVAFLQLFFPYPKYLILEYGIDHPGEMDFLLSIVVPDVAVLTQVEPNHMEQFGSIDLYRNEKIKLIQATKTLKVVHETLRQFIENDVVFYSLGALSEIHASHIEISPSGTQASTHFQGTVYPLHIPAIGSFQIENLLPLYVIAQHMQIQIERIQSYAKKAKPESGRSGIIGGVNNSMIIDGSYNGGYLSLREGILSMKSFFHKYHIVFFLGDMRELGDMSREMHLQLAHDILEYVPHDAGVSFYLVGPMMREYVLPELVSKFDVFSFLSSRQAGARIHNEILQSTQEVIVYVKGSQNTIFLEEGIKEFLGDPKDISLLPRQNDHWMSKKEAFLLTAFEKNI